MANPFQATRLLTGVTIFDPTPATPPANDGDTIVIDDGEVLAPGPGGEGGVFQPAPPALPRSIAIDTATAIPMLDTLRLLAGANIGIELDQNQDTGETILTFSSAGVASLQAVVTALQTSKLDRADVVQTTGNDINKVMSQAAVTAALGAAGLDAGAVQALINTAINNLVNAAPSQLDTLNELAAALGNDANFAATVTTSLAGKLNTSAVNTGTFNPASNDAASQLSTFNFFITQFQRRVIDPYTLPVLPINSLDPAWTSPSVAEQFGVIGDLFITQRNSTTHYDTVAGAPITPDNPSGNYVHAWRGVNNNLAFRLDQAVPGVLPIESISTGFSVRTIMFESSRSNRWIYRDASLNPIAFRWPRNWSVLLLLGSSTFNSNPIFSMSTSPDSGQMIGMFINSGFISLGVNTGTAARLTKVPSIPRGWGSPVLLGISPAYPAVAQVGPHLEFMTTEITSAYANAGSTWNDLPVHFGIGRDGVGGSNRFGNFRIAGVLPIKHPNSGYRFDLVQAVAQSWIEQHQWQL